MPLFWGLYLFPSTGRELEVGDRREQADGPAHQQHTRGAREVYDRGESGPAEWVSRACQQSPRVTSLPFPSTTFKTLLWSLIPSTFQTKAAKKKWKVEVPFQASELCRTVRALLFWGRKYWHLKGLRTEERYRWGTILSQAVECIRGKQSQTLDKVTWIDFIQ